MSKLDPSQNVGRTIPRTPLQLAPGSVPGLLQEACSTLLRVSILNESLNERRLSLFLSEITLRHPLS